MERIDTVIVGGGQAGLATSYYLTQQGREHVVLEQAARAANVWRNERWDSFTLVTPNWTLKMWSEPQHSDHHRSHPWPHALPSPSRTISCFRGVPGPRPT